MTINDTRGQPVSQATPMAKKWGMACETMVLARAPEFAGYVDQL